MLQGEQVRRLAMHPVLRHLCACNPRASLRMPAESSTQSAANGVSMSDNAAPTHGAAQQLSGQQAEVQPSSAQATQVPLAAQLDAEEDQLAGTSGAQTTSTHAAERKPPMLLCVHMVADAMRRSAAYQSVTSQLPRGCQHVVLDPGETLRHGC